MSGHNNGAVLEGRITKRGSSNGNARGSSEQRRRRREWLVSTYRANVDLTLGDDGWLIEEELGQGIPCCRCYRCGDLLTVDTVTVDRIIPGCRGGDVPQGQHQAGLRRLQLRDRRGDTREAASPDFCTAQNSVYEAWRDGKAPGRRATRGGTPRPKEAGMTVEAPVSAPDPWCTAEKHGTLTARTSYGCKCQATRDLWARYQRGRDWDALQGRPRRMLAIGSRRRLRALQRLGWTSTAIAAEMGVTRNQIKQLMRRRTYTNRTTHEAVCAAYDRLSMRLPPESPAVRQLRAYAERRGWPPPLAWDDDEIDDPKARPRKGSWTGPVPPDMAVVLRLVESGERVRHLTHEEAAIAVRLLRQSGISDHQIKDDYRLKPERYREDQAS